MSTEDGTQHDTLPGAAAAALHDKLAHRPVPQQRAVDPQDTEGHVARTNQDGEIGVGAGPQVVSTTDELEVQCGPLLNFRHMGGATSGRPTWNGSVLIVTTPGQIHPQLLLKELGAVDGSMGPQSSEARSFAGFKLYEDPNKAFWRFLIDVPHLDYEARWEYQIPKLKPVGEGVIDGDATKRVFAVPSISQSMRILFHSCNGFSVGTDVDAWSGPALWNEVNRLHATKPFHVMIGGGDQIYNDGVRVDGPLKAWTSIGNPKKRQHFPFNEQLRAECDEYYYKNYIRWYSTRPFADANGQIPQLNIWDDHDIIDGFGSYTDHFMRCAVFRGIGGVAHKYVSPARHACSLASFGSLTKRQVLSSVPAPCAAAQEHLHHGCPQDG